MSSDNRIRLLPALKGLIVGVIVAAVLLFVLSAVAYFSPVPDLLTNIFGYASLYLSAAVMGAVSSRLSGDDGGSAVICAAISGAMLIVLVLAMSLLPAESAGDFSPLLRVLMYAGIMGAATLAGLIFMPKRHKAKHRRRR